MMVDELGDLYASLKKVFISLIANTELYLLYLGIESLNSIVDAKGNMMIKQFWQVTFTELTSSF